MKRQDAAFGYFLVGVFFVGLLFTPNNPTVSRQVIFIADLVDGGIAALSFITAWFCWRTA